MKYEIIKNATDDYTLKYKDKEIKMHSNVEIMTEMQQADQNGKLNMIMDLAKKGMTVGDLIIEKIVDGKKYEDHSSKDEMAKMYADKEKTRLFNEAIKKMTGKTLVELAIDIEIENDVEQCEKLSKELGEVMAGRFQNKGQK